MRRSPAGVVSLISPADGYVDCPTGTAAHATCATPSGLPAQSGRSSDDPDRTSQSHAAKSQRPASVRSIHDRPERSVRAAARRGITDHLPELRSALEQQRQFRVDQLAAKTATAADLPRLQVAVAVGTAAAAALADVEAALHRIDEGSYGTCEHCDVAIPLERLEILPMVRLCMRCQRAFETGQPTTTRRTGTLSGSTTRLHTTQVTHDGDPRQLTSNRCARTPFPMRLDSGGAPPKAMTKQPQTAAGGTTAWPQSKAAADPNDVPDRPPLEGPWRWTSIGET